MSASSSWLRTQKHNNEDLYSLRCLIFSLCKHGKVSHGMKEAIHNKKTKNNIKVAKFIVNIIQHKSWELFQLEVRNL